MNGGLRSLGGRLERRMSRSAPHFVAPLDFISKPMDWRDLVHTHEEATQGCRGHCGTSLPSFARGGFPSQSEYSECLIARQ